MAVDSKTQLIARFPPGKQLKSEDFIAVLNGVRLASEKVPVGDVSGFDIYINTGYSGEAKTTTVPVGTKFQKWAVATAGIFPGFKDENNNGLVVEAADLQGQSVEFWGSGGVWRKIVFTLTGNFVTNNQIFKEGGSILSSAYQKIGYIIGSTGVEAVAGSRKMISQMPVLASTVYEIGGWTEAKPKILCWYDAAHTKIGSTININVTYPAIDTLTSPVGAAYVSFNLVQVIGELDPLGSLYFKKQLEGGDRVTRILNSPLEASMIAPGSICPDPVDPQNAANQRYVDDKFADVAATYLPNSDLTISGLPISLVPYRKDGFIIGSTGVEAPLGGRKMISQVPVQASKSYDIGGWTEAKSKILCWYDASHTKIGSTININLGYPAIDTLTSPAGAAFLSFNVVQAVGELDPTSTLYFREHALGSTKVSAIKGYPLEAALIAANALCPDPVSASNPVNKGYFDQNSISESDLTLSNPVNLTRAAYLLDGQYIQSTGAKGAAAGWAMWRIPVVAGDVITFGNFSITPSGYMAFYSSLDAFVSGTAQIYNVGTMPKTVTAPENGFLYVTRKRPADADSNSVNAVICKGAGLLPWSDPEPKIIGIKGKSIAGSSGGSNVAKFSDLTDVPGYAGNSGKGMAVNSAGDGLEAASFIRQGGSAQVTGLVADSFTINNMPEGNGSPPAGLAIGRAWLDITDPVNPSVRVKRQ